jgi:hypothetical protein
MLIAKCYATSLHVDEGGTVRPRGAALMHDPTGRHWPRTSCLIGTFKRTGKPIAKPTDEASAWATDPAMVKMGMVHTPNRSLEGWKFIGRVNRIDYTRHGAHADMFTHEFKDPHPRLYRKGHVLRLELGRGAEFNWRGFVKP